MTTQATTTFDPKKNLRNRSTIFYRQVPADRTKEESMDEWRSRIGKELAGRAYDWTQAVTQNTIDNIERKPEEIPRGWFTADSEAAYTRAMAAVAKDRSSIWSHLKLDQEQLRTAGKIAGLKLATGPAKSYIDSKLASLSAGKQQSKWTVHLNFEPWMTWTDADGPTSVGVDMDILTSDNGRCERQTSTAIPLATVDQTLTDLSCIESNQTFLGRTMSETEMAMERQANEARSTWIDAGSPKAGGGMGGRGKGGSADEQTAMLQTMLQSAMVALQLEQMKKDGTEMTEEQSTLYDQLSEADAFTQARELISQVMSLQQSAEQSSKADSTNQSSDSTQKEKKRRKSKSSKRGRERKSRSSTRKSVKDTATDLSSAPPTLTAAA